MVMRRASAEHCHVDHGAPSCRGLFFSGMTQTALPTVIAGLLVALMGLTLAVWWPGLTGPFFLDDLTLLPLLARIDPVQPGPGIWAFITDTSAGPYGRPLSMLALLANGTDWPTLPWLYKFTNLLLHASTGLLLFFLVREITGTQDRQDTRPALTAWLVSAFWLIHPLNVSTLLYVTQRMTQLSAFFVLLGLLCYVRGRKRLSRHARAGYVWMNAAVLLCLPLATLSKENGLLLAPMILLVEWTVFRLRPGQGAYPSRLWMLGCLWLPTLALLAMLTRYSLPEYFATRDFTLTQRLLSEPRIVLEYLWRWFNPWAGSRGVFTDGIIVSTGWLQPRTTLPALLAMIALPAVAFLVRHRAPWMTLAVGFFLVGHILESTSLPLELYFEHRNYLPTMLLALPLVDWLMGRIRMQPLWGVLPLGLCVALAAITLDTARIWGDAARLARYSLQANPLSPRAIGNQAGYLVRQGRAEAAVQLIKAGIQRRPEASELGILLLLFECQSEGVRQADLRAVRQQLAGHHPPLNAYALLGDLLERVPKACPGLGLDMLEDMLVGLEAEAERQGRHEAIRRLRHYRGILCLKDAQPECAIRHFARSQQLLRDAELGLIQAALLLRFQYPAQAAAWLSTLRRQQSFARRDVSWGDRGIEARARALQERIETRRKAMDQTGDTRQ